MEISGKNFIGDKLSGLGKVTYKTIDPLKILKTTPYL